jgi:dephospho-CoA kinase
MICRVIWSLINDEEYELASLIARTACRKEAERYKDAPYVIFDRHWMTMFTLIPEEFLDSWFPLPFTVLIEAETQTIVERLNKRNEKVDTPFEVHLDQQQRFREVAERHQVAVINTSSELADTSVNRIISLINGG